MLQLSLPSGHTWQVSSAVSGYLPSWVPVVSAAPDAVTARVLRGFPESPVNTVHALMTVITVSSVHSLVDWPLMIFLFLESLVGHQTN